MTTTTTAWVIVNDAGQFLNSRNVKFDSEISVTSHVYFNFYKANKAAKAYEAEMEKISQKRRVEK